MCCSLVGSQRDVGEGAGKRHQRPAPGPDPAAGRRPSMHERRGRREARAESRTLPPGDPPPPFVYVGH
eukprot:6029496-Pyramimonas_sp.AAC.1